MIIFNYKFHLFHAIGTFIIFKFFLISNLGFISLIGTFIGFMIPDIDSTNSIPNKIFIITKYVGHFFKHRGFLHSPTSLILFTCLFYWIELKFGLVGLGTGVFIGYFSHLIADFTTKRGIRIFWPKEKFYRICFWDNEIGAILWIVLFIILMFIKLDQLRFS